ncbi:cytochrome c biogenesis heme-transporting ATPase CcmA [Aidingimonas halophila]|uniref:Heme exporter protein A n=1 Tax=Aidingimonas halophila TaxID=574349 RepID=A0A1H2V978_9GAMM|nr:cytochrome c biogenesis heme-transporting ATPase CcmA [Aidingimonas halophila]GHC23974.1 cytochrome c biogenesis ATP-binding export protein CcmA [Aidingimonas halophila]SDW64873.1 heme exporter protein A [Aidingimonas halophila]
MNFCLRARGLACERDDRCLFRDLDIDVGSGDLVRIEGPNGSGKTTLLKILSGQLDDYQGTLSWCDRDMTAVRGDFHANLLYLGHAPGIHAGLTALENLAWYQALGGESGRESDRMAALASVGLSGFEDVLVGQLSAGQQRRVALARLELTPRLLWILDEPFTAIDKAGVAALERRLLTHVQCGGGVLMTTHHEMPSLGDIRSIHLGGGAVDA